MMAAWNSGGAMSVRILNTEIYRTRCATLEAQSGVKSLQKHTLGGLRTIQEKKEQFYFPCSSRRRLKRLTSKCVAVACESTSQIENPSDHEEIKKSVQEKTLFAPSSLQVESLVTDICETNSIAEFELDFGGFRLYLERGLEEKSSISPPPSTPSPPPSLPAVNSGSGADQTSGSTALTISKSKSGSTGIQRFLDSASDEGLAILQSPKVGFFRRSRIIKGKRAPPSCQEKQVVKEGQVLCYIEQLGGEIPIESDVSGEVIKILRKDGEPVGYGDALIAVLPSFPGIKKLQL